METDIRDIPMLLRELALDERNDCFVPVDFLLDQTVHNVPELNADESLRAAFTSFFIRAMLPASEFSFSADCHW